MLKLILSLLLAVSCVLPALAQDAQVVILTPEEAASAKAAYAKLQAAQKEYAAFKDALIAKHQDATWKGFGQTWQFSSDFGAMVPYWTALEAKPPCLALSQAGVPIPAISTYVGDTFNGSQTTYPK